jgi:hypothetical protein
MQALDSHPLQDGAPRPYTQGRGHEQGAGRAYPNRDRRGRGAQAHDGDLGLIAQLGDEDQEKGRKKIP